MIERKVKWSSIVTLIGAILGLLVAFGVNLTPEQTSAVLAVAVALGPILTFVFGWLAPHTERPDLNENG